MMTSTNSLYPLESETFRRLHVALSASWTITVQWAILGTQIYLAKHAACKLASYVASSHAATCDETVTLAVNSDDDDDDVSSTIFSTLKVVYEYFAYNYG